MPATHRLIRVSGRNGAGSDQQPPTPSDPKGGYGNTFALCKDVFVALLPIAGYREIREASKELRWVRPYMKRRGETRKQGSADHRIKLCPPLGLLDIFFFAANERE